MDSPQKLQIFGALAMSSICLVALVGRSYKDSSAETLRQAAPNLRLNKAAGKQEYFYTPIPYYDYNDPCGALEEDGGYGRALCCSNELFPVLGGIDAVQLRFTGEVTYGSSEHTFMYKTTGGSKYMFWFSTRENMQTFSANPKWYFPQFGGFDIDTFCNDNMAGPNTITSKSIDPHKVSIRENVPYFFSSDESLARFERGETDINACRLKYGLLFGDQAAPSVMNTQCFNLPAIQEMPAYDPYQAAAYNPYASATSAADQQAELGAEVAVAQPDGTPVWLRYISDSGEPFYYNVQTGESTWQVPVQESPKQEAATPQMALADGISKESDAEDDVDKELLAKVLKLFSSEKAKEMIASGTFDPESLLAQEFKKEGLVSSEDFLEPLVEEAGEVVVQQTQGVPVYVVKEQETKKEEESGKIAEMEHAEAEPVKEEEKEKDDKVDLVEEDEEAKESEETKKNEEEAAVDEEANANIAAAPFLPPLPSAEVAAPATSEDEALEVLEEALDNVKAPEAPERVEAPEDVVPPEAPEGIVAPEAPEDVEAPPEPQEVPVAVAVEASESMEEARKEEILLAPPVGVVSPPSLLQP